MTAPSRAGEAAAELVVELAELLQRWSYEGTTGAEAIVARVGDRYGVAASAVFLPDSAIVTVGGRTVARSATPVVPPLHQVSALKRLLLAIDDGGLEPAAARERLAALQRSRDPFGAVGLVAGMVCFSVGFGVSVQSTWQEVWAAAALGLLVGLLVLVTRGRPRLELLAPLIGSTVVSALVLVAYDHGWIDGGPIQLMVPALFYFIPGDALAAAMLELADGRVTAGASRLIASLAVLLMLGFGALIATVLVSVPQSFLFDVDVAGNLGPLAPLIGWTLFAVGVMLVFQMDRRDFPWALALVLGTAAVAAAATAAAGDPIGTFVGALAMTVTALLLGRRRDAPPPYVLYLGAFYVLTPGSHGLRGVESWIGGHRVEGLNSVADMLGLLTAIALGMLIGAVAVRRPLAAGT